MVYNGFGSLADQIKKYFVCLVRRWIHSLLVAVFVNWLGWCTFMSIDINREEYRNSKCFWTVDVSFSQCIKSSHCQISSGGQLSCLSRYGQQQRFLKARQTLFAYCSTIVMFSALLCLLLFDVALPNLTLNVESDGRSHSQLKVNNICIGAPGLKFKELFGWLWTSSPAVDLMLGYDCLFQVQGIQISCKGVQSVHKVDLSQLWDQFHNPSNPQSSPVVVESVDGGLKSEEKNKLNRDSAPGTSIVVAHAVDVQNIDILLDPTLVSASQYILTKDILLKLNGARKSVIVNDSKKKMFVSVLINVRRVAFIVQNMVPSASYELILQACVYKRQPGSRSSSTTAGGSRKKTSSSHTQKSGRLVEHSFCLRELTLHSWGDNCKFGSMHFGSSLTTSLYHKQDSTGHSKRGLGSQGGAATSAGKLSDTKELLLQINDVSGFFFSCNGARGEVSLVQDVRLDLGYLYVKPVAGPMSGESCGNSPELRVAVASKEPHATIGAALIVYSKYTSLFAFVC